MSTSLPLSGQICLVTGASRGIGRGIALQLGEAGATVYVTGRTLDAQPGADVGGSLRETAQEIDKRGGVGIPVQCDHSLDEDVKKLFKKIEEEQSGRLDVLVNNAYSAVTAILNAAGKPFWEQGLEMWDTINNVGLRNHYICSVLASQLMVPRRSGLIVNISSAAGLRYLFNVAYGVGKEALDRMSVDMAVELKKHNIASLSIWPGAVKTELISKIYKLEEDGEPENAPFNATAFFGNGETVEYAGKAVVALASDPNVMAKSGRVWITADLGQEYGFRDEGNRVVYNTRSMKSKLESLGHPWLAKIVHPSLMVPRWLFSMDGNKL